MKAFVIMEIAVQLPFRLGSIRLVIRIGVGIKLVAFVIPPCVMEIELVKMLF
jgi:hypothetical protein